jgi:hypothetical protein
VFSLHLLCGARYDRASSLQKHKAAVQKPERKNPKTKAQKQRK